MSTPPGRQPPSDAGQEARPDDLDALIAAPDHHTLLFENDRVRMFHLRCGPSRYRPILSGT